jgi:hypothetical protein
LQSTVEALLFRKFTATHVIWEAELWVFNEVEGGPLGHFVSSLPLRHDVGDD